MAIDSAFKRKSISGVLVPGATIPGVVNAAKPEAWRRASAWGYYGMALVPEPGAFVPNRRFMVNVGRMMGMR